MSSFLSAFLVVANIVFFAYSLYVNAQRVKQTNNRAWLRIPAVFISAYICSVYIFVLLGIIDEAIIGRYFMRWFQLVIAAYLIIEARNG